MVKGAAKGPYGGKGESWGVSADALRRLGGSTFNLMVENSIYPTGM